MNAYFAEFLPVAAETLRPHRHAGGEFIYVLTGTLEVALGDEPRELQAGDSMYFDSDVLHTYRRVGARPCSAIVVTRPT